jgi:hypothetical protein
VDFFEGTAFAHVGNREASEKSEAEIVNRYSKDALHAMGRNGYSGLSAQQRAEAVGLLDMYHDGSRKNERPSGPRAKATRSVPRVQSQTAPSQWQNPLGTDRGCQSLIRWASIMKPSAVTAVGTGRNAREANSDPPEGEM